MGSDGVRKMSAQILRDLEVLAGLFKSGGWRELRVQSGTVDLLISTDIAARQSTGTPATPLPASSPVVSEKPAPASRQSATVGEIDPAWIAVKAPTLGTFYSAPKPGAPPFVNTGDRIEAGAEICLIEVMKLFTSVAAPTSGVVKLIAVADAQLVQGGQPLLYIEKSS